VFEHCQIRRTVPFQDQVVGKMQALTSNDKRNGENSDRRESHRRIPGDRTELIHATVPMVEALQAQALLPGVSLQGTSEIAS
jgi:hypothetical protein